MWNLVSSTLTGSLVPITACKRVHTCYFIRAQFCSLQYGMSGFRAGRVHVLRDVVVLYFLNRSVTYGVLGMWYNYIPLESKLAIKITLYTTTRNRLSLPSQRDYSTTITTQLALLSISMMMSMVAREIVKNSWLSLSGKSRLCYWHCPLNIPVGHSGHYWPWTRVHNALLSKCGLKHQHDLHSCFCDPCRYGRQMSPSTSNPLAEVGRFLQLTIVVACGRENGDIRAWEVRLRRKKTWAIYGLVEWMIWIRCLVSRRCDRKCLWV